MQADPVRLRLEASTACQLRCPTCATSRGLVHSSLGTGLLSLESFLQLLNKNPQIRSVELSNYGEVFLNPQLCEILRAAHERNVEITMSNGVNLNRASLEALQALVDYQVRRITVALDGVTQETYARYRVRGQLETVIGHVQELNRLKAEKGSRFPVLTWQFVLFEHNAHEVERARLWAAELGMEFFLKPDWKTRPVLPPAENGHPRLEVKYCQQLWNEPQVNFDGRLLGCCVNYWADLGSNVFESSLRAAVNEPRMRYARAMLLGLAPPRSDIACTRCGYYLSMLESGQWMTVEEATAPPPSFQVGS